MTMSSEVPRKVPWERRHGACRNMLVARHELVSWFRSGYKAGSDLEGPEKGGLKLRNA